MSKIICTLLIFISFKVVFCQEKIIWTEIGIGQYELAEIKNLQSALKNMASSGVLNIESVEAFPATRYLGIGMSYRINRINSIGVFLYNNSTAGRNHLKDYSGEYKMDILLNSYAIGLETSCIIKKFNKLSISGQIGGGIRLSTLKFQEKFTVFDENIQNSNTDFFGYNFFINPLSELSYKIYKNLNIGIKMGYEFNFRSSYHYNYNLNQNKLAVNVDYSGLRFGFIAKCSF